MQHIVLVKPRRIWASGETFRPSAHVWALVSGLPKHERGSRLAMLLQAFVDDSRTRAGRSPRIFMLGGLIASYDNWAAFADEWHSELSKPPGANYFKLSQALSLTDEFDESKGWTVALRDDRVYALAVIARRHALCGISCTLDESLYDEFVRSFSSFKELRDPYFLCFHQMVDAITSARGEFPEATGLDYVFDEQGDVGLNAVYWWKRLKAILPFRAPSLVGSTPVSRDEKKFRPLQAADLYAGLQRHQLEHAGEVMPTVAKALEAFRGFKAWQRSYSKEDLMALGADLIIKKAAHRERRQREGEG